MTIKSIHDLRDSASKNRLLSLPHITTDGITDWIDQSEFSTYGFKTGNGTMRRGIPEGFPKGMQWERFPLSGPIQRLRCLGFTDDPHLTSRIRSDIRKELSTKPCTITGSTANVEIDHRAGNKTHPLHIHTDDVTQQKTSDFMPLCRAVNQIKREACKQCVASGERPPLPPMFGGRPMKQGQGCYRCFWFEPESYI